MTPIGRHGALPTPDAGQPTGREQLHGDGLENRRIELLKMITGWQSVTQAADDRLADHCQRPNYGRISELLHDIPTLPASLAQDQETYQLTVKKFDDLKKDFDREILALNSAEQETYVKGQVQRFNNPPNESEVFILAHILCRFPRWGASSTQVLNGLHSCHKAEKRYRLQRLSLEEIATKVDQIREAHHLDRAVCDLAASSVAKDWTQFLRMARLEERMVTQDTSWMDIEEPIPEKKESQGLYLALNDLVQKIMLKAKEVGSLAHEGAPENIAAEATTNYKRDLLRFGTDLEAYRRVLGVDEGVIQKYNELFEKFIHSIFAQDDDQLSCTDVHFKSQPFLLVDDVLKSFTAQTEANYRLLPASSKLRRDIDATRDGLQKLYHELAEDDNLFKFLYQNLLQGNQRLIHELNTQTHQLAVQLAHWKPIAPRKQAAGKKKTAHVQPRPQRTSQRPVASSSVSLPTEAPEQAADLKDLKDLKDVKAVKAVNEASPRQDHDSRSRPLRAILEKGHDTGLMTRRASDADIKQLAERIVDKGTFPSAWGSVVYHYAKHRQADESVESWLNAAQRVAQRMARSIPRLGKLLPCISDINRSLWHVRAPTEGIYIVYTNELQPKVVSFERRAPSNG